MISLKRVTSSSLVKNSIVYIITDGVNKSIPFLLLPFLTYYLTPSAYGIVANFNVLVQILSVFCYVSTAGTLTVKFYKLDKEGLKAYISNMIFLNAYATIACLVIMLVFHRLIYDSLQIDITFQLLSILLVWFASLTNVNLLLWRCEEQPFKFGVYQISQTALNALTTIWFVIILLLGWQGRIYSMFLSTALFGIISWVILYRRGYIAFKQSRNEMREILFFALPLIPHALSFWLKSGVDKVLLTEMCGLTDNGLYSVAMTWGAIVSMFAMSFNNAYVPYLYKKLTIFDKDKEATLSEQRKVVKMIYASIFFSLFFVGAAYAFSYFFILIVYEPSYHASLSFLPYVMIGQFFNACYIMFACFAHYTFKTKGLGAITFSLSLLQVVLSYLFIRICGAIGAAISSAVVMALTAVCVSWYGMKIYRLPWLLNK